MIQIQHADFTRCPGLRSTRTSEQLLVALYEGLQQLAFTDRSAVFGNTCLVGEAWSFKVLRGLVTYMMSDRSATPS